MVLADVVELERGAAELDVLLAVDDLVGDDDVIRLELRAMRALAFLWAIKVAPRSLNGLPPAMWSKWLWL